MRKLRSLCLGMTLSLCVAFGCPTGTTIVRADCGQMSTPGKCAPTVAPPTGATVAPATPAATAFETYILLPILLRILWLH